MIVHSILSPNMTIFGFYAAYLNSGAINILLFESVV